MPTYVTIRQACELVKTSQYSFLKWRWCGLDDLLPPCPCHPLNVYVLATFGLSRTHVDMLAYALRVACCPAARTRDSTHTGFRGDQQSTPSQWFSINMAAVLWSMSLTAACQILTLLRSLGLSTFDTRYVALNLSSFSVSSVAV